ncbi:hypothetical protein Q3G72_019476 [Acer saccharum]|nr:hypothetical protein Q3G72_019476 [Acer saccharum]
MKWEPLLEGCYKNNTDAALNFRGYSPQVAEAMALLPGIAFMEDASLLSAIVEFDALGVLNLINTRNPTSVYIGLVMQGILACMQHGVVGTMSFVTRKANVVAHNLSKLAVTITDDCFWLKNYPHCVDKFVPEDFQV